MNKNREMFKCFLKVMHNDKKEIAKILPNMYAENFYKINKNKLLKKGINALIIDIDGTILEVDSIAVPLKLKQEINGLKKHFDICLVSNNYEKRVAPVAEELKVLYLSDAKKPLKKCFDNALNILNIKDKNKIAMIGDQMMSDIKGANEYGIYSVLVKPITKHNNIKTKTSRVLQNIMERHLKTKNIFDKDKYY